MDIKKIMIATDGGPTSETVTAFGVQLGLQLAAEMALVSVVDADILISEGNVSPYELRQLEIADRKQKLQLLLERTCKGQSLWTFVEEGKPSEKILELANEWQADLLVLGTHARRGVTHLLMGSVAEKVVRHSTKPTLIIPTHT